MPEHSETKINQQEKIAPGIISTLAFFSLYNLPLSAKRIHELLAQSSASLTEVEQTLSQLVADHKILQTNSLYALKRWDVATYNTNQIELTKKWAKIDRWFNWLSLLPFVRGIAVINSLALGTADSDSDIDFFVVTKKNRLYFVRSVIIVLFRILGVYKTRTHIKDRFCFGFFVDEQSLEFEKLMLKPRDPYFVYWLASLRPIAGGRAYHRLMQNNLWLKHHFPNFEPKQRDLTLKQAHPLIRLGKGILEVLLWLPVSLVEPLLRNIHIKHTFKLAENNTVTSSTIANRSMLKLHGYDVRAEVASEYERALNSLR